MLAHARWELGCFPGWTLPLPASGSSDSGSWELPPAGRLCNCRGQVLLQTRKSVLSVPRKD